MSHSHPVVEYFPCRGAVLQFELVERIRNPGILSDIVIEHCVRRGPVLQFEMLERPFDWGLLRSLGPRFHVLACPHDDWLSKDLFDHMVAQVPGLQVGRLLSACVHVLCAVA